jgi:hypothetical protein
MCAVDLVRHVNSVGYVTSLVSHVYVKLRILIYHNKKVLPT